MTQTSVEEFTMSPQTRRSAVARAMRPALVAGVAAAGAAFWLATASPEIASATPQVKLTSVGSSLLPPAGGDCTTILCANMIGEAGSTTQFAAGASSSPPAADAVGTLLSTFVSNGTAEHPDAGLLIGNGYQGAPGQDGGRGGLLIGSGGDGGA